MDVLTINWDNEVSNLLDIWEFSMLTRGRFNAVAFYLDIADMLAKEGL